MSRQLVYEHFENLAALRLEVTRYLFEEMFEAASDATPYCRSQRLKNQSLST